jgi:nucleoid DNA-binding protein
MPATSAKSFASPTITLKHMAAKLAVTHGMSKRSSEAFLADMVGLMVRSLKKGERLRFSGLGILHVRKRAARTLKGDRAQLRVGRNGQLRIGETHFWRSLRQAGLPERC